MLRIALPSLALAACVPVAQQITPANVAFDPVHRAEHVRVLPSDQFQGRGPVTPGEQLTLAYIAEQFRAAGLQPGASNGSWFQDVLLNQYDIVGAPELSFTVAERRQPLSQGDQIAVRASMRNVDRVDIATSARADAVVVLGRVERDLTGDGRPEVLRLIGIGESLDSLDVTFTITSAEGLIYETSLHPLKRDVSYDGPRHVLTRAQHRAKLNGFGAWFFGASKFRSPDGFLARLREGDPDQIPRIPDVIAEDRRQGEVLDSLLAAGESPVEARRRAPLLAGCWRSSCDVARAVSTWEEIQSAGVTVFIFSPGGDAVTAIAWSERDRRFYRLWECC